MSIYRMTGNKFPLMMLLSFLFLFGCGGKSGDQATAIDPTLMWQDDQAVITPAKGNKHIWSGFYVKDNYFVSYMHRAKLVVWRKSPGRRRVSLRYQIEGKPVILYVNDRRIIKLVAAKSRLPVSIPVGLKKGFNIFEFKKQPGTQLKIEFIRVGSPDLKAPGDLRAGDAMTAVLPPGRGSIRLQGQGEVEIRSVEFSAGLGKSRSEMVRGGKVSHRLAFESPGFVRLIGRSGAFDITDFSFSRYKGNDREKKPALSGKPGIFIFLIDGCQQSHLGIYGYRRNTSPCIDELASDAVVFDNAYANATFTGSSVATIFTGMFPQRHKLKILINKLSDRHFLLAEFLRDRGYRTGVFSEAGNISPRFGFGQGVDTFPRLFFRVLKDQKLMEEKLHQSFDRFTGQPGPLFAYVHFRAPHFPIVPPPPFRDMFRDPGRKTQGKRRLVFDIKKLVEAGHRFTAGEIAEITDDYDSAIRFADDRVGRLVRRLKEAGLYDDALVIFTSDHGEALNEHGALGHGFNVYPETSLVPLIIKFPASMNLKGRVRTVVNLADIFPTVASLFDEQPDMDGTSLFNAITQVDINDNMAISTSFHNIAEFGIRWRDWYYLIRLKNNQEELFNLSQDLREDVSASNKDVLLFFRGWFLNWLKANDQQDDLEETLDLKKLPPDVRDHLRTLGYIE